MQFIEVMGRREVNKLFHRGVRRRWVCRSLAGVVTCWLLWWTLRRESNPLPAAAHTDAQLAYLRSSRSLKHYLDNIHVLIEPSSPACAELAPVPLVALVTSAPGRRAARDAARRTWARHQPTYFVMGLDADRGDDQLINNYMEAKQRDDLVVFDFADHHQNLTTKVALAMRWLLDRCPQAEFLLKVEDDVLINPWTLQQVLRDNQDSKIVGSVVSNEPVVRQPGRRGYTPRWLYPPEVVPEFVSGHTYLINGNCIRSILKAAYSVPMVNHEQVYYTHLVSTSLGYSLSDDVRLTPWGPHWPSLQPPFMFWPHASVRGLSPQDVLSVWPKLEAIGKAYENNETVCEGMLKMALFIF